MKRGRILERFVLPLSWAGSLSKAGTEDGLAGRRFVGRSYPVSVKPSKHCSHKGWWRKRKREREGDRERRIEGEREGGRKRYRGEKSSRETSLHRHTSSEGIRLLSSYSLSTEGKNLCGGRLSSGSTPRNLFTVMDFLLISINIYIQPIDHR